MKYVDEFRNGELAKSISKKIQQVAKTDRQYHFMEFCGGHTHTIFRYGIPDLLPSNVTMIHGPGCPVCVLPMYRIDQAIELAQQQNVIFCSYGDMLRVPGSQKSSLLQAKAQGADIRMLYSIADALTIARDNPSKKIVFFAIGFETTTPPTALAILQAQKMNLMNFFVFCNHVLTPAAIVSILDSPEVKTMGTLPLDGFIGPAHVSTVIGSRPYESFATDYKSPVVIAGFEPLDVLQAIYMLIKQVNDQRSEVENEFIRAVTVNGNEKAKAIMAEVFELRNSFEWRGLGQVPNSALKIKTGYQQWDAEVHFSLNPIASSKPSLENKACECPAILRGIKKPLDCKLFGTVCTPENPIGSCMVSSEGACAAYYNYGRHS